MAVFLGILSEVTCPVYASVHVYTEQVTFFQDTRNKAMFN